MKKKKKEKTLTEGMYCTSHQYQTKYPFIRGDDGAWTGNAGSVKELLKNGKRGRSQSHMSDCLAK